MTGRRILGVPLPVALFFLGMMLPTSVGITLGGLRLSAFRVVLMVMFLPMLVTLLSGRRVRANIFDALVLGHALLALAALVRWGGVQQGLESGGIYVVEFAGAWLMGRVYIRSHADFRAFARAFVLTVVVLVGFTLPEALTAVHILHDGLAAISGGAPAAHIEPRMGLERAFGPFDHPILYGVFSAAAFSMAWHVVAERRLFNLSGMAQVGGVGLATFLSASGGPYLVLIMQGFVAAWERVFRGVQGRWLMLWALFALIYLGIDLFSNRTPFHVFVTHFTFSTQSAYNRILLFDFGMAEVRRNPLLGIGLGDWTRPSWMSDSMDNFWLLIAMRYGVPAWAMMVALVLGLVVTAARRQGLPEPWKRARHAWAFTLFGIAVAAATVHLWNALFVLFVFLIGAGAWLVDAPLPAGRKGIGTAPLLRPRTIRPSAPVARLF